MERTGWHVSRLWWGVGDFNVKRANTHTKSRFHYPFDLEVNFYHSYVNIQNICMQSSQAHYNVLVFKEKYNLDIRLSSFTYEEVS